MLTEEKGGRSKKKKKEDSQLSPNETPHKQTIVSSNICFQQKAVKLKTQWICQQK